MSPGFGPLPSKSKLGVRLKFSVTPARRERFLFGNLLRSGIAARPKMTPGPSPPNRMNGWKIFRLLFGMTPPTSG